MKDDLMPQLTMQDLEGIEADASRPGAWEAIALRTVLANMDAELPEEEPHERFRLLCDLAEVAFPTPRPSDADIAENGLTPVLVRFLLEALRRYNARAGGRAMSLQSRLKRLGEAFLVVPTSPARREDAHGFPFTGKWTLKRRIRYCVAFAQASDAARLAGSDRAEAYEQGLMAAYQAYRAGHAGEQDESDRREVLRQLQDYLDREGFGLPP